MYDKILSLGLFTVAYVLFVLFPTRRSISAMGGAVLLVVLCVVGPVEAFGFINWNVMGIFLGMLVLAELLMQSNMPAVLAESLVSRAPRAWMAMLLLCMLSGFISSFAENVATVMLIVPIALKVSHKINISPVPLLVGVAVAANLQGTATLIGDSPSMLLAGAAGMSFNSFFIMDGKLSIFFFVEAGAVASFFVLYLMYRRHHEKIHLERTETLKSWVPTVLLALLIVSLAVSSFYFTGKPRRVFGDFQLSTLAGVLCLTWAIIGLVWHKSKGRKVIHLVRTFDWDTGFFLMGVFVLVGALSHAEWIDAIANGLGALTGGSKLGNFVLIMAVSVAVSGFVDNVPYVAAMLPVAAKLSGDADPRLLMFGMVIAACIGGNVTPIGASANVVTVGYLRRHHHHCSFWDFMKIGLPFTVAATSIAGLCLWLVWA